MNISAKYYPNDTVWIMRDNLPVQDRITFVEISININMDITTTYILEHHGRFCETQVFKTKKELREHIFGE